MRAFFLVVFVVAGLLVIASGWKIPGVMVVCLVAPKHRHSTEDPPAQKKERARE